MFYYCIYLDVLMHFVLPFVALMLLRLDLRRALPIAALGIVPNLDVLFLFHRSYSHSVIVIGLVVLPFFLYSWKVKPGWLGTATSRAIAVMDLASAFS